MNYVALGDSLAVGTGASYKGYVDRYADYLSRTDTKNLCSLSLKASSASFCSVMS